MKSVQCLVLTLLLLLVPGCRDHQETLPDELKSILDLGITRPLEVVLVSPQGETSGPQDYQAVTVVFNQPMKALTAESPNIPQPFTLEPKVEGRFRWKGTATVSFEPHQPLKFGTEYTVTVGAGITAAGGAKLGKAASYTFTTPGPAVVLSSPANNAPGVKPGQPIVLGFDQAVDPAKVGQLLSFTSPSNAPKPGARALSESEAVQLNKDRPKDSSQFVARNSVVVDVSGLQPGTSYALRVDKGLVGESGPLPSTKESLLGFTTLKPFAWMEKPQKNPSAPEAGIELSFSTDVSLKMLKEHLRIEPKLDLAVNEYDQTSEYQNQTIYADLTPNSVYNITIDADFTDIHGQKLGREVTFPWKTGDRQTVSQIAEGIGVLEAKGLLAIPMGLQNVDTLSLAMARVESAEMMKLAARENTDWLWGSNQDSYTPDGGFTTKKTIVPDGPRNQMLDRPIDLTEALKGRKFGFVLYDVTSSGQGETYHHRGLAQVTNLGATGKFSPENCVFVATALDTAKPLGGVEATVVDGQGRAVWSGTSGSDGRIEAPGWTELLGPSADQYSDPPLTLFLKKGDDQVFIRNGGFGGVYPWMFDITYRWNSSIHQPALQAYTERGLYLPGEEVQLKGAIRDRSKGQWVNPDLAELNFELFNSRDESMEKGTVKVSDYGTFHQTIKVPAKSATGVYRVDYSLDPASAKKWGIDKGLSGVSFRVEEFQPADFKVGVTSATSHASMGQIVDFQAVGEWLFGSPMNGEEVQWASYITPATYSHKDYPGYDFGPLPLDNDEESDRFQDLSKGKGVSDNMGHLNGQVPLKGIAYRGDGDLTIEATIVSSNRRSITGHLTIPVARGAYRIGLKPATRFIQGGEELNLQVITLQPDGKPMAGNSLKLELIRREWNSVRKTDADGLLRWVTEVEDKVVETQTLKSKDSVLETTLKPAAAGFYIARVTSEDGQGNSVLSESSFYSQGSDYVPWGRSDGDKVDLVADKATYVPGETAKILIKSPYKEATALITYERDMILHSYTTQLVGSAPVIEVPLTEKHLPNVYVSVMLLRGRIAEVSQDPEEDAGKPAFKIGYVNLPVAPDSQRLKVEMATDKPKYGPGEEVVTKLKVTDQSGKPVQAEFSLTAADVGVLNLIDYQTPDFFETFYGSLPLSVHTSESRLDVIGQRSYGSKGETQGGGGGYNPAFRTDFRLTAVWEPQIVTDKEGQAEVRFRLPENLTTFRVMTTAISKDTRCGSAETEIVISKPLVLKASAPAFARIGDDFQAGVLAVNGTDKDSSLKLVLEAEGVDSVPEAREIFLKAGEEREVLFPLKASKDGTAVLRFSGTLGSETDGLQIEIPLQRSTQKVTLAVTGQTTESNLKETVKVPDSAVEGTAKVEISLAPTLLIGLQASIQELLDYPYGCLEQRLSRVTPLLFTDDLVQRFALNDWPKAEVRKTVQENLDLLAGYAAEDGGLKTWPDAPHANPYLTALAVRTAHIAQTRGYKAQGPWLVKARAYLKGYLDSSDKGLLAFNETEVLTTKAAALEALSRFDFKGQSYLNNLMDRRSKMSAVGRAFLLEAAHRMAIKDSVKTLAGELSNSLKMENATAHFEVDETATPWLYSSDVHDTAIITTALLNSEQKLPMADKVVRWLLEARNKQGTWGTTANNAAALEALWAYAEEFESKATAPMVVTTSVAGTASEKVNFGAKTRADSKTSVLKTGETSIEIAKQGEGRLYYDISVSYQDSQPSPAIDEGMTVLRAITDLNGRGVTEFKGGEMYKVRLSVIAPSLRRYVVLENPVPAGFSVVKTDFATESKLLAELLERGSQPSWQTFFRFEDYADRILLFADALAPGEHLYEYLVRAQTPGVYQYPAAQVEEMYHPELFGRTGVSTVTIK